MSMTQQAEVVEVVDDPPVVTGDPDQGQQVTRPTFTITDAATTCSVSRKTITRKLPELAGHGAAKDDDGVWRIPVEALLAVGLHPGRSRAESPPHQGQPGPGTTRAVQPPEAGMITISRDRWDDVRIRLARAEAEASERALALADARLALRALTAGPGSEDGPVRASSDPGPRATVGNESGGGSLGTAAGPSARPVQSSSAGGVATDAGGPAAVPLALSPGPGSAPPVGVEPQDEIVAARMRAAQYGGYVPAAPIRPKRRRWWQKA